MQPELVEVRDAFKMSRRKPRRKRPFGRQRRKLEDNFRMYINIIVANTRNWVDSALPTVMEIYDERFVGGGSGHVKYT